MSAPTELATTTKSLPEPVQRRGISAAAWNTLCKSLYPGANPNSVLLVIDYCQARNLDPLKKPCHIVPMEVKDAKTGSYEWRDVVMPGIYELRTTAQRTGDYLGHSQPTFGPPLECAGVTAPESCSLTIYRWHQKSATRVEFPVTVYFREVVGTKKDGKANSRWSKAPIQMLVKCAEAAGLREAFPDEIGGQHTAEEMDGQRAIDVAPVAPVRPLPDQPASFEDWIVDLQATTEQGPEAFAAAWAQSPEALRTYLAASDPARLERLRVLAASAGASDGELAE